MIPHVAQQLRDYLADTFGVPVFHQKPSTRPPKAIVFQQIPAPPVTKPRTFAMRSFLIHCWDSSDITGVAAELFADQIREALLENAFPGMGVHRVMVPGEPGRYDDPKQSGPRFQLTITVLMKATSRAQV